MTGQRARVKAPWRDWLGWAIASFGLRMCTRRYRNTIKVATWSGLNALVEVRPDMQLPQPPQVNVALVDRFTPPEGWFMFGHHARFEQVPPLVFYGQDEVGDPLWERPA